MSNFLYKLFFSGYNIRNTKILKIVSEYFLWNLMWSTVPGIFNNYFGNDKSLVVSIGMIFWMIFLFSVYDVWKRFWMRKNRFKELKKKLGYVGEKK